MHAGPLPHTVWAGGVVFIGAGGAEGDQPRAVHAPVCAGPVRGDHAHAAQSAVIAVITYNFA